jgi:hypothetical protein
MNTKIIHLGSDRYIENTDEVHIDSDIGWFTILAEWDEYHANFVIYEIGCSDHEGNFLYRVEDENEIDFVKDYKSSTPYLHGTVKWDGCSNWYFDEQEQGMLHFCTQEGLVNLGRLMAFCWQFASESIHGFDK